MPNLPRENSASFMKPGLLHPLKPPSVFLLGRHGQKPWSFRQKSPSFSEKFPTFFRYKRENSSACGFPPRILGYFAEYKYICMPIIIKVPRESARPRVNSRFSLAENRWLVNRGNDNLIELGVHSLVTTKIKSKEWTL